jgi:N-sulfoglucosamine sulfohydrolase
MRCERRMAAMFLLCGWIVFATNASSAFSAAPKNVVLVVSDDHSPDMGCYGNPVVKTPHLDALAAEGTRFVNAFCTTASCSASRSVILSGLHNHANGQYGHQHHFHKFSSYDNLVSLPVYLAHAGYRTARCGKYHVAPEPVYQFETTIPGPTRNGYVMAENCRKFIGEESDKPFFLYFCVSDPHRGGGVAKELPHQPDRFGNPAPGNQLSGDRRGRLRSGRCDRPGIPARHAACRAELAQYYQSISRIDQGVGRLIQVLKDEGVWDQTLMIYISDHGIAMPGAKTTLYDGGMLSPLLVRHPDGKGRGVVHRAMVSWVDLTPTILDFAGALDRLDRPRQTGRAGPHPAEPDTDRSADHRRYRSRRPARPLVLADPGPAGGRRLGHRLRLAHLPRNPDVLPDARGARAASGS